MMGSWKRSPLQADLNDVWVNQVVPLHLAFTPFNIVLLYMYNLYFCCPLPLPHVVPGIRTEPFSAPACYTCGLLCQDDMTILTCHKRQLKRDQQVTVIITVHFHMTLILRHSLHFPMSLWCHMTFTVFLCCKTH